MSAYIVAKSHIAALVASARAQRQGDPLRWYWGNPGRTNRLDHTNEDAVGQMLVDCCVASVYHRYPNCDPNVVGEDVTQAPGPNDPYYLVPYQQPSICDTRLLAGVALLKAIDGYEYQSCERDDWKESEAYAFCDALRCRTIYDLPGYDTADWEVTS